MQATFIRPLNTGEPNDIVLTATNDHYIAYAIHPTLGIQNDGSLRVHPSKVLGPYLGRLTINFSNTSVCPPQTKIETDGYLSADGNFKLTWKYTTGDANIEFTMQSKKIGWMGVGLAPSGNIGHVAMDTYWGFVSGGVPTLEDARSNSVAAPAKDATQNVINPSTSSVVDGFTTITFSRPVAAAEANDYTIVDGPTTVSWGIADSPDLTTIHSARGRFEVNLLAQGPVVIFAAKPLPPGGEGARILVLGVAGIFCLWAFMRHGKKFLKCCLLGKKKGVNEEKFRESTLDLDEEERRYAQTSYDGDQSAQGGRFGQSQLAQHNALLTTRQYQKTGDDWYKYDPKAHLRKNSSFKDLGQVKDLHNQLNRNDAKKASEGCFHSLMVFGEKRVGGSQVTILQLMMSIVWGGVNIASVFLGEAAMGSNWGYLAAVNALFVAVPAQRNGVLNWVLGIPFDKVISYHRWLGRWLILCIGVHMGLYYDRFQEIALSPSPLAYGFWSFLFGIVIFITSLGPLRRKNFDFFFWAHFAFLLFYAFMYMHDPACELYVIIAGAMYAMDRLIRAFWGLVPRKSSKLMYKEGNIVQVCVPKHPVHNCLKSFKVGQYVFGKDSLFFALFPVPTFLFIFSLSHDR